MGFEFYKESYAGSVRTVSLGEGSNAVVVGGESCYPFYQFEGDMPHKPRIAMEIWDITPEDWPEAALSPFREVVGNVSAWAKKCVDNYDADIIVLQLKSIDPNGQDASPEEAVTSVKKVLEAVKVPLVIWGIANPNKDEMVFKKIAEECQDYDLVFGPVEDKNHKSIGAAAMGYGHAIISSSPIDVNLAKQVNILLENLGMSMDKVLIDPTTGGLGYGLEYSYSVMERLRMAAITQGDDKLQMPIINNLGNEVWKSKEAKQSVEEAPLLGDPEKRGILMESVAAVAYLMAGSNILIMRHPESVKMVKSFIDLIMGGGLSDNVSPITKNMESVLIDFAKLSPIPDLTIEKVSEKSSKSIKKTQKKDKKEDIKTSGKTDKSDVSKVKVLKEKKISEKDLKVKEVVSEGEKDVSKAQDLSLDVDKKQKEAKRLNEEKEEKLAKEKEERLAKEKEERLAKEEREKLAKEEREANEEKIREERATKLSITKGCLDRGVVTHKVSAAPEQKREFEKIIDQLSWIHRQISLY